MYVTSISFHSFIIIFKAFCLSVFCSLEVGTKSTSSQVRANTSASGCLRTTRTAAPRWRRSARSRCRTGCRSSSARCSRTRTTSTASTATAKVRPASAPKTQNDAPRNHFPLRSPLVFVEPGPIPVHQVRWNPPQPGCTHIQSQVRQSRFMDAAAGRGEANSEKNTWLIMNLTISLLAKSQGK